jgi:hypothetical protein
VQAGVAVLAGVARLIQRLQLPFLERSLLKLTALVIGEARADDPGIATSVGQLVDLLNDPRAQAGQHFVQAIQADKGLTLLNGVIKCLAVASFQTHTTGDLREVGLQILPRTS